jgi:glycogen debranching enzyme
MRIFEDLYHEVSAGFGGYGLLEGSVSVVSPGAYAVSDGRGDFGGSSGPGLFHRDVRHLSRFVLRVDGEAPIPLGVWVRGSEAEFVLEAGAGSIRVVRRRTLGGGIEEEISLTNDALEVVEARVEIGCAADFRDVFDVRGYRRAAGRGELVEEVKDGCLRFAYRREGFRRGTVVRVSGGGIEPVAQPGCISFGVRLEPGEERSARVAVVLEEGGEEVRPLGPAAALYREAPVLETGWDPLRRSWKRSVEDLQSLSLDVKDGLFVPAAGAPWYMALFGRDSLITAYQTMILGLDPAKNTLKALARYQAGERDDFRDAEPGKIPHELRVGELAFFDEIPQTPYYGTADATPLFLILLHEVWRWSGDAGFVRDMEGAARRALDWVLHHAERIGGYVAYATRSPAGLQNHGWKDSVNSVLFRDGSRAEGPIAPCEVQGYVYDAYRRSAELAELVWEDEELARELRAEADTLKERFDRDFWIEDRSYYALALDGAARRVDSVASNAGHLLWSGIVPPKKARLVADRLVGEELFCGWGIRTMAAGEGGYDPVSYHNGSVWPHDNALIACGLGRYGFREEAGRVVGALLDAAPHFDYRLPEVFAGYSKKEVRAPVELPKSCSPQAWAAGTVPLLVRTMLGAEPDPKSRSLVTNAVLPGGIGSLRLEGVSAFGEWHALGARDAY